MSLTEQYLAEVRRNVFAPPEQCDQFLNDLKSHIEEATARGESEAEAIGKLGRAEDVAAEFMSGHELKPAGFWIRVLAMLFDIGLIDTFLFGMPLLMLGPRIMLKMSAGANFAEAIRLSFDTGSLAGVLMITTLIGWIFLGVVFGLFYFPVLEKLYGTTFGKRILKLRVVKESGGAIGFGEAFLRRISFYIDMLAIDALFIPFNKKKQRAFDMVAKTMVIHEPWLRTPPWMAILAVLVVALPTLMFIGLFSAIALSQGG